MSVWTEVLDSCPGLLCCVVNLKGKLLHATHGYKVVAYRLLGHKCEEGRIYPPMITNLDNALHELLKEAAAGETNAIELSENGKIWELTASPLKLDSTRISGVIIRIAAIETIRTATNENLPPVVYSNPNILEAVPFRACVADSNGIIIAVNKFLAASFSDDISGKNINEIAKLDDESEMLEALIRRSGNFECSMKDISMHENFYDIAEKIYLDEEFNDAPEEKNINTRRIKIHASPTKWNDKNSTLLTFEDVTEINRTKEQLRRLLTFDTATGILNRRGIEHIIFREFGKAIRNTEQLSLIAMNIDKFRSINKARGYKAGNSIIRDFVFYLKKCLAKHPEAIAGRWGGDEFMILVHCSGAAAVVLSNEIRERTNNIALSAGVSDITGGVYSGMSEFIAAAYDAMSEAKRKGGNQTVLAENAK